MNRKSWFGLYVFLILFWVVGLSYADHNVSNGKGYLIADEPATGNLRIFADIEYGGTMTRGSVQYPYGALEIIAEGKEGSTVDLQQYVDNGGSVSMEIKYISTDAVKQLAIGFRDSNAQQILLNNGTNINDTNWHNYSALLADFVAGNASVNWSSISMLKFTPMALAMEGSGASVGLTPDQVMEFYVKSIVVSAPGLPDYKVESDFYYIYSSGTSAINGTVVGYEGYEFEYNNGKPQCAIIVNNTDGDYDTGVDVSAEKSLSFEISGDTESLQVMLANEGGSQITGYRTINNISSTTQNVVIDFNYFGDYDYSDIASIRFVPVNSTSVTKSFKVKNISFGSTQTYTNEEVLVDELIANFGLDSNKYPNLSANYKQNAAQVWKGYKKQFIDDYVDLVSGNGLDGLVFDTYSGSSQTETEITDHATSESSGYGMLLALYMNDQDTFNRIWLATKTKLYKSPTYGGNHLFAWKVTGNNTQPTDWNSATDADQDIAIALVFADILVRRGIWTNLGNPADRYGLNAQYVIDAIYKHDFEFYRYLRMGDFNYGGRTLTNLSYFSPAWYRIFDKYEWIDHDWDTIIDQGYAVLAAQTGYSNGLAPDWCDSWGQSVTGYTYNSQKEAMRVYMRLATDAIWFDEPRAKAFLANTIATFPDLNSKQNVSYVDMNGTNVETFNDVSFFSMYAAGAMGTDDAIYKAEWKQTFDTYLYASMDEENSYFGKYGYDGDRYNYYNQSLALFGSLMMAGALPNIHEDIDNTPLPTYKDRNFPATFYKDDINKFHIKIGQSLPMLSPKAKLLDLRVAHAQGSFELRVIDGKCQVLSQTNCSVDLASIEKSINSSIEYEVTFNVQIDATWSESDLDISWRRSNDASAPGNYTYITSIPFVSYPKDYVSDVQPTLSFGTVTPMDKVKYTYIPLDIACSSSSWNISVFSDNDPSVPGNAGMVMWKNSVITHNIPVQVALRDDTALPATADWITLTDLGDVSDKVISQYSSASDIQSKYLHFKTDFSWALHGGYNSKIFVHLFSDNNVSKIDDFEDANFLNQLGSYWVDLALYTDNTNVQTVASKSIEVNGFGGTKSLKLSYTLGSYNNDFSNSPQGNPPQAAILFAVGKNNAVTDISEYRGLSFVMKSSNQGPLTVALEPTNNIKLVMNYDLYETVIPKPSDEWTYYEIYFDDMQLEYDNSGTTVETVLQNMSNIQIKTLIDHEGETGEIQLDNISFIK